MNRQLEEYIVKHKVTVSNTLLFRDWEAFLKRLFTADGRVEMIVWYEYCRINAQKIGMGGYKAPVNNGYMWAETPIYQDHLQGKSMAEILEYICKVREAYPDCDLSLKNFLAGEETTTDKVIAGVSSTYSIGKLIFWWVVNGEPSI